MSQYDNMKVIHEKSYINVLKNGVMNAAEIATVPSHSIPQFAIIDHNDLLNMLNRSRAHTTTNVPLAACP